MGALKILGYNYVLDRSKTADEIDSMGRFHAKSQVIQLASDLCEQAIQSTLLHEIMEAINLHLKLNMCEEQIMGLEVGLHQALTENGVDLAPLLEGR